MAGLPTINADLLEREKQAALARGEEWIDPEELAHREEAQREADRITDLREHCAKKGLDFDTENQKYLDKQAAKQRKAEEKKAKAKK